MSIKAIQIIGIAATMFMTSSAASAGVGHHDSPPLTVSVGDHKKVKPTPPIRWERQDPGLQGYLYNVHLKDDMVVYFELLEKATGKLKAKAYPYGKRNAVSHDAERRVSFRELKALFKVFEKKKTLIRNRRSTSFSNIVNQVDGQGVPIGYDETIGFIGNATACYKYTPIHNGGGITYNTVTYSSSMSTEAVATNLDQSVKGSYGGFEASQSFSYSNEWSQTDYGGSINIMSYYAFNMGATLDPNDPLTYTGQQYLKTPAEFAAACGGKYTTLLPVGMYVVGDVAWSSSDSDTATAMSAEMKAEYEDLGKSLEGAVSAAYSKNTSDVSMSLSATWVVYGGGEIATDLTAEIAKADSHLTVCKDGDTKECDAYYVAIREATTVALDEFTKDYVTPLGVSSYDTTIFEVFPNGIVKDDKGLGGIDAISPSNIQLADVEVYGSETPPALDPDKYQVPLFQYIKVLNEVSTLSLRAKSIYDSIYLETLYNTLSGLSGQLSDVAKTYSDDRENMLKTLEQCFGDDPNNAINCDSIVALDTAGALADAYAWYDYKYKNALEGQKQILKAARENSYALQYHSKLDLDCTDITVCGDLTSTMPLTTVWTYGLNDDFYPSNDTYKYEDYFPKTGVAAFSYGAWTDERGVSRSDPIIYFMTDNGQSMSGYPNEEVSSIIAGRYSDGKYFYSTPDTFEKLTIKRANSNCTKNPCQINAHSDSGYPGTLFWGGDYGKLSRIYQPIGEQPIHEPLHYGGQTFERLLAYSSDKVLNDKTDQFNGGESGSLALVGLAGRVKDSEFKCINGSFTDLNKPFSGSVRGSSACADSDIEATYTLPTSPSVADPTKSSFRQLAAGFAMGVHNDKVNEIYLYTADLNSRYSTKILGPISTNMVGTGGIKTEDKIDEIDDNVVRMTDNNAIMAVGGNAKSGNVQYWALYEGELKRHHQSGVADFSLYMVPTDNFFKP